MCRNIYEVKYSSDFENAWVEIFEDGATAIARTRQLEMEGWSVWLKANGRIIYCN